MKPLKFSLNIDNNSGFYRKFNFYLRIILFIHANILYWLFHFPIFFKILNTSAFFVFNSLHTCVSFKVFSFLFSVSLSVSVLLLRYDVTTMPLTHSVSDLFLKINIRLRGITLLQNLSISRYIFSWPF